MILTIRALDDGRPLAIMRGWSQWTRGAVLYRQYHHDDGTRTILARMDGTWFTLTRDHDWRANFGAKAS